MLPTCRNKVGFGRGIGRQHQAGAVTQSERRRDIQRLEVLRLARRRSHSRLFGSKERIDGRGLAHIGVAREADHKPGRSICGRDLQACDQLCV